MTIPLSSITFGSRTRSSYTGIPELAASIRDRGLIHPIVLAPDGDSKFIIAAGGRRFRAIEHLGLTELHHNISSVPGLAGFLLLSDLSPEDLSEIELEENLFRLDLSWQDRALLVDKIHTAHKLKSLHIPGQPVWGVRQTGELLGTAFGDVSMCTTVAKILRENPKLISTCVSVRDAIRVILTKKTDEALKLQLRNVSKGSPTDLSDFFDTSEERTSSSPETSSTPEQNIPKMVVRISKQFKLGDCLEVMDGLKERSFDHVVCDPPYGIDLSNMNLVGQERVQEQHQVDANLALLEKCVEKVWRILKDKGFFVFFYDLDHHEKLRDWCVKVGFSVQRWPLIWSKDHPCKNQAPAYNWTKNFEVAMVCRKGNATLIKPQTSAIVVAEGQMERKLYDNPFAKPFAVWKFILDAVAHKGQTVFDPFFGEGSSCKAAITLGLTPYGCEIEEHHFNKGIVGIKESYKLLYGEDGVEFK